MNYEEKDDGDGEGIFGGRKERKCEGEKQGFRMKEVSGVV